MKLRDQVENALNETRMLTLGAQVLIGFHYNAAFTPRFERLSTDQQQLVLLGLALMLIALALLLAPSAFHQIVEHGNDSQRILAFTGHVAGYALLPIALGMGADVYLAVSLLAGTRPAVAAGSAMCAVALVLWYGLEWGLRWSGRAQRPADMPDRDDSDLSTRIKLVMTEARTVLPGAQALLGFQLAAVLTDSFEKLPSGLQQVHVGSLGLIALAVALLMAPAAFHRIVERGRDSERMHTFSSAMVLSSLVPLGLGIGGDLYVVAAKVLGSQAEAATLAAAALVVLFGLWFGVTLFVRTRSAPPPRVAR